MYIYDLRRYNPAIENKFIGNYLVRHGIPLLSRKDNKMMFAKTDEYFLKIKSLPWHIKLFRW